MKKSIFTSILILLTAFSFGQSIVLSPVGDDVVVTRYGSLPVISGRRASGTSASPTAVSSGLNLLLITGQGFNGSGFSGDGATISLRTSQNWNTTNNGSQIVFSTTPNNSTLLLDRMIIANDGKVGIGTSSPATKLHINEPSASSAVSLQLTNTDAGSTIGDGLHFGLNPSGLFSFGASIINKENSYLVLGANNNQTQLFLEQTGNVGINTLVAQDAKLTIEANSTCCSGIPYSTLTLRESEVDGARLRFTNTHTTSNSLFWDVFGSPLGAGNEANAAMNFYYSTGAGTGNNVMSLKGNGRVGIGVGSPLDRLHIEGGGSASLVRLSTTSGLTGIRMQNNGTGASGGDWSMYANEFNELFWGYSTDNFVSATTVLRMAPNGANYNLNPTSNDVVFLGSSTNRWKEIFSVLPLNTSSDRRLKKNIVEIKYGLEDVLKLNAVTYNWKNGSDSKLHLGFIAQEVDKIIPEIVSKSGLSDEEYTRLEKEGKPINDTYGMEYTGLIPVLVKAIQEQQQMIEDKALKISQLEEKSKRMNDLEARLSAIEASLGKPNHEVKSDKK